MAGWRATIRDMPSTRRVTVQGKELTTYLVKQLELALRARVDGVAAEEGLTGLQYISLVALRSDPPISSAELARRSGVSPQSAGDMITSLEGRGLVSRTPKADNRRILEVRVTDEGLARLRRCDRAMRKVDALMTSELTSAEAEQLGDLLRRCRRTLAALV